MKTLFQLSSVKYHSRSSSFTGKRGCSHRVPDLGCEQEGNSPSHFCNCLTCAQDGVRPGIGVKEDVFHISIRTNSTDALSQFV
jgi:hypothetical protein